MKTILTLALLAMATPVMAQQADGHARHVAMDHAAHAQHQEAADTGCTEDHAAMGHCTMEKPEDNSGCEDCCEDADCAMDCCKDGECEMDCCEDRAMQCDGDKDCCAGMDEKDHHQHQGH